MTWQHITYFISIVIAAAVSGFIAWYSWRKRKSVAGAGIFMWMSLLMSLFSIFQGLSMIGPSMEWALFWFKMKFVFYAGAPVLWLLFVLHYAGKQYLCTKARITALFVIPVITLIMLWTNDLHRLWLVHDVVFRQSGPFFTTDTATWVPGLWMNVHNIYSNGILLSGVIILFVFSARLNRQYRGQSIALGVGIMVMIIGTLFATLNLVTGMVLNPLPHSYALGSLIIAWGLYRHGFLDASIVFDEERRIPRRLVMLFVFLTGGILATGFLFYWQSENHFKAEVESRLSSIAELKVGELVQWRKERLSNANVLHGNTAFTVLVRRFFSDSTDGDAHGQIRNWFEKMQSFYQYDHIYLLDVQGNPRLSVPHSIEPVCGNLKRQAADIMRAGRIVFLDFHREAPGKPIHLAVVVPVIENGRPLGLVVLSIDPAIYLYPMINRWPMQSSTAETLLVRRDGNDVLYLNELKFRKNTALVLRVPLTDEKKPAVLAALGREGIVEGIDYQGVPVVAALRSVPGSPWFLVARMGIEEVNAPLRELFWVIIIVVLGLLAAVAAGIMAIWRKQGERFFREKAEAAERLQESEEKYRLLFENAGDAIFIADAETEVILDVNSMAEKLLDMPRLEIIGMNRAALHPRTGEYAGELARHAEAGQVTDAESMVVSRAGRLIPVRISATLIELEGRKVVLGIFRDITDRKQVEIAFKMSKDYLENILNFTGDPIFVKDDSFRFTLVNNAFCYMLEMERKDIIGKTLGESLPEDQMDHFLEVDRMVLESGVENQCEELLTGRDGKILTIITKKTLFVDELGNKFIIGVIHDITSRKRLEEVALKKREELLAANARLEEIMRTQERSRLSLLSILEDEKLSRNKLHDSEEKFSTAFRTSTYAITITCIKDGRFIEVNDAFLALSGLTREEAIADSSVSLNLWAEVEDRNSVVSALLAGGEVTNREFHFKKRNGEIITALFSAQIIHLGGDPFILSSINDITQRKRTEDELASYRDHLEELVRDRTAELEHTKVAAEAANRSKTRFLSSMSHEIRTPLNAILGFSELLIRDRELTDKQRERMETVNRSGEHLLGLINDILEISKIEEGRSTINPAPFDLIATLGNIESMFLSKIDAKGLSFRMETAGVTARYIVSDEAKLRQILVNLVGNAAKFTIEGGVALRVRTVDEGDGVVVLTADVEDTGPGISETEMAGLFRVFEQGIAGVKAGGTGLGLAISRQFARLMGGDISARSEEGKGSCFTLRIAARAGESTVGKAKTGTRTVSGLEPGQGPFRVLVADDQPDNRMLIREFLVPAGFEIMEACDGIETIDLFKSWSPHVILMDKRMPRMNGYEAMLRIKEIDPGGATKIVAVTASAFSEDRDKAMDWGADAYLPKPFKAHELFECIGSVLGVRYVYEEETPVSAASALPLTPESLDGLPDELVEKMHTATVGLDRDGLFKLIEGIAANEPETGQQLSDMVKNYQYEALIALMKRRLERK